MCWINFASTHVSVLIKKAPSYMGAFRDMGITQINICTSTLYLLGFSKHETKRFIRVKGLAAI